jgi:hypothetical protein
VSAGRLLGVGVATAACALAVSREIADLVVKIRPGAESGGRDLNHSTSTLETSRSTTELPPRAADIVGAPNATTSSGRLNAIVDELSNAFTAADAVGPRVPSASSPSFSWRGLAHRADSAC